MGSEIKCPFYTSYCCLTCFKKKLLSKLGIYEPIKFFYKVCTKCKYNTSFYNCTYSCMLDCKIKHD